MTRLALSLFLVCTSLGFIACARQAVPAAAAPAREPSWLLGGWFARTGQTPFGPMPMQITFRREADGSLRGHAGDTPEQYIDLHLHRGRDGQLWLQESAALPGVGVQSHLLAPAGAYDEHKLRFRHAERPELLEVLLERQGEKLVLAVVLRGQPHVRFELERMP